WLHRGKRGGPPGGAGGRARQRPGAERGAEAKDLRGVLHDQGTRQRPGHGNCETNHGGARRADRRGGRGAGGQEDPPVAEEPDMTNRLRVAVADDEREMREYLQEVLPRLGHQVVAVGETGRQLVEQCRVTKPDLVISDVKMPDLDGIEVAVTLNRE